MTDINKNTVIEIENKKYFCIGVQKIIENDTIFLTLYDYDEQKIKKNKLKNIKNVKTISLMTDEIVFNGIVGDCGIFTKTDRNYTLHNALFDSAFIRVGDRCIGYFFEDDLLYAMAEEYVIFTVKKCERKNSAWEILGTKNVLLEDIDTWINVPVDEVNKGDKIVIDTKNSKYIKKAE